MHIAFIITSLLNISLVKSYNIFFYHDWGTKSHLYVFFPLIEELLARGHSVTGVFYASAKISHENYTEVVHKDLQDHIMKNLTEIYMRLEYGNDLGLMNPFLLMKTASLYQDLPERVLENLKNKEVQALLKHDYDILITIGFSAGYIAHMLDCPMILLSPGGAFSVYTDMIGNRVNPGTTAAMGIVFQDPSQFSQRLRNFYGNYALKIATSYLMAQIENVLRINLNYTGPSLMTSMVDRTQMVLANSHAVTQDPQPLLENVVHVGGIHIKPSKPLPSDLQELLDSSPEGVLLVSFGSSLTPSSMTSEKRKVFLRAFEMLKMPVIWKWDTGTSDDVPPNVLIRDWLPQQDLLAHPNLKVILTHGGLLSIMEAIYHETIVVGIPFVNDQRPNLVRLESKNIGVMLNWKTIDEEVLVEAINRAIHDKSMADAMGRMSRIFRDVKERPVQRAAWWVEYVVRNNGTDFMKPLSMNLLWYHVWNLDILAAGVALVLLSICINFKILQCFFNCCSGKRKTKTD